MRRWIMHVDMDAFYASVEQRDNPEYRGHPVIVGGLSSRGVVATASYEARKLGVHSAMSIVKAKELCPQGIYLRPRMSVYHNISEQIHEIMHRYTPYIEPLSLDEAFLDVTGCHDGFTGPYALGKAIKQDIWRATGLVASVGVAPNKYLAKLASDIKKPNGLVVVPYGQEAQFVETLPVERLWGVGRQMTKLLQASGFYKIGQIAALPDEYALKSIAGNQAKRLYDMARGIDDRPVEYERQVHSIGNELTYEQDLVDQRLIEQEWYFFAHKVAKRLRQQRLKGHTIAIKVRFNDFETLSRQKRIDIPTDNEETLYRIGMMLYNKLNINKPIRLLGLTVSDFDGLGGQTSLFEKEMFQEELTKAVDGLEAKFGEGIVRKGALWQRAIRQKREEENHNETF